MTHCKSAHGPAPFAPRYPWEWNAETCTVRACTYNATIDQLQCDYDSICEDVNVTITNHVSNAISIYGTCAPPSRPDLDFCCVIATPAYPVDLVRLFGTDGDDDLNFRDDSTGSFLKSPVETAKIFGGDGHDLIHGSDEVAEHGYLEVLRGEAGSDIIFGHDGDDVLDGGMAGSNNGDHLVGGAGNDWLDCGPDLVLGCTGIGGAGEDVIYGTMAEDFLFGDDEDGGPLFTAGDDIMYSRGGGGEMHGGNFADIMFGGDDAIQETINGNFGFDTIHGGGGPDVINGGPNADTITGGDGDDTIHGDDTDHENDGDDIISGGGGVDTIFGDGGDDILWGGLGDDFLEGGFDSDTLCDTEEDTDTNPASAAINTLHGGEVSMGVSTDDPNANDRAWVFYNMSAVVHPEQLGENDVEEVSDQWDSTGVRASGVTPLAVTYPECTHAMAL